MPTLPNPYQAPTTTSAPAPADAEAEVANRWLRLGGGFIDGIIMMILVFGGLLLTGHKFMDPTPMSTGATITWAIVGVVLFLICHGFLLAKRGQTIGKLAMGTRIVQLDGQLMPFGPLILRRYLPVWIVTNIPFIGQLLGLVNVLFIFREDRRCLHDLIAGTKVVKIAP